MKKKAVKKKQATKETTPLNTFHATLECPTGEFNAESLDGKHFEVGGKRFWIDFQNGDPNKPSISDELLTGNDHIIKTIHGGLKTFGEISECLVLGINESPGFHSVIHHKHFNTGTGSSRLDIRISYQAKDEVEPDLGTLSILRFALYGFDPHKEKSKPIDPSKSNLRIINDPQKRFKA